MKIRNFFSKAKWQSSKRGFINYLHGDKEVWEYDFIAKRLTFLVRIFYLIVYFMIFMLPFFMAILVIMRIEIEYLGILFGAIAAGIFTTIASLSNTESNLRNIRCSWIDESRKDFMNYRSMGRKFLSAHYACRVYEIKIDNFNDNTEKDTINNIAAKLERARLDRKIAAEEFYELYVKVSLRFRGKKNKSEKEVYGKLKEHYKQYRELSSSMKKAEEDVFKEGKYDVEYKLEDRVVTELFGNYLNEEWKRAKKGDADILNKKKALFAILVILAVSFVCYFIGISLNKKDDINTNEASKVVVEKCCNKQGCILTCV